MKTSDFDYRLPANRIAQRPAEPRDSSRLMVVTRTNRKVEHKHFFDIAGYLRSGDLLVWNDSKVFKARLYGQLVSSTGEPLLEHRRPVEILLVREMENPGVWQVLARPGRHVRAGARVSFAEDFYCDVLVKEPAGTILVQFPYDAAAVRAKANQYGLTPLPPYIKDERHELDTYQTVYASREGSVAAPTAGFHFTPSLIEKLKAKGVEFASITLHVGLGTFLPVKTERVADHTMHSEWVEVSQESAAAVNRARAEGRRVVAVGTTTARTLEGVALLSGKNDGAVKLFKSVLDVAQKRNKENIGQFALALRPYQGDIKLFITPGFKFQVADALITNFHLPKSTLLMLVCAFAGDTRFVLDSYQKAVAAGYRFYSFGDAMFIE